MPENNAKVVYVPIHPMLLMDSDILQLYQHSGSQISMTDALLMQIMRDLKKLLDKEKASDR